MILIIAEKPSLARNIVAGIGEMKKTSGWFEGQGYVVTWAFGHLFSLCDVEDYLPRDRRPAPGEKIYWSMEGLPCFPEAFKYKMRPGKDGPIDQGVAKQFENIKFLCQREDVDTIVNAGDADREGEIIVRLCVQKAFGIEDPKKLDTCGKKLMRLWLPDQTPETVKNGLAALKGENEYESLAGEGFARTYIDWLYGVNLTRYATLKTGNLMRVGRVIVPIVKAIYDRDMAIRNFKPDIYYSISSNEETNGCPVPLNSKLKFAKNEKYKAEQTCAKYNGSKAFVSQKKTKKDTLKPGKLYSLSKLQNVLGKKFKMPMEKSLELVQKLYEAGYLTYPRTNSEYLATAEKDKIKKILENVKAIGYDVMFKDDKTIFDDSKIESHSAITPTYKIPNRNQLTPDELTVYSTVMRRFAAVFCAEPCLALKTEITVTVENCEDFVLKGTVIQQKGWTKYDDCQTSDKILPNLEKGDSVNINFKPVEKETSPPKHYTIETLNNYLKNPFREEKARANSENQAVNGAAATPPPAPEETAEGETGDSYDGDDAEEYRMIFEGLELGTEATRTGIINNAIISKYIELKKDVYYLLPGGEDLIESLSMMGINMDKYRTSEMGRVLKKVFHGEINVEAAVDFAEKEVGMVFGNEKAQFPPETDRNIGVMREIVGKCPFCGNAVTRTKFGYGCQGYKEGCKFGISMRICSRAISVSNVKLLLETGSTSKIQGFISPKSGKSFDAKLKLNMETKRADFNFD